MKQSDKAIRSYYRTGNYKNYYKVKERYSDITGQTHITFTNGIKEFFACGRFREEALKKVFNQIDQAVGRKKDPAISL